MLHKEYIGLIVVSIDIFSIFIILHFFRKLKSFNDEFQEKFNMRRVEMKSFGIKIDNLILDKYTQDSRVIKMKIWLYFNEIINDLKMKFENDRKMNKLDIE